MVNVSDWVTAKRCAYSLENLHASFVNDLRILPICSIAESVSTKGEHSCFEQR